MRDNGWMIAWGFLVGLILVGSMIYFFNASADCSAKGGELVRGAFSYACVAGAGR